MSATDFGATIAMLSLPGGLAAIAAAGLFGAPVIPCMVLALFALGTYATVRAA